jgi:hypothetical protein
MQNLYTRWESMAAPVICPGGKDCRDASNGCKICQKGSQHSDGKFTSGRFAV